MLRTSLTGYRSILAAVEAAGTPWHIAPDASPAERIAHSRRMAAHQLHIARSDTAVLYRIVRRYAGDRRWGRVDMNPEARPVLASIRRGIRSALSALRAAEEIEATLQQIERLAA